MNRRLCTLATLALALALTLVVWLQACGFIVVQGARYAYGVYKAPEKEVKAALEQVRSRVLQSDLEGIGLLLAADAQWSSSGQQTTLVGRANILRGLTTSTGFKMAAYELAATQTDVHGDTAVQQGSYRH